MNWCEQRGIEVVHSAGKAKEQQHKVEHHAQLFELMLDDVLPAVQPQTECECRECLAALQEAKDSLLSVSGVSPIQLVSRDPGDHPDLIASSSVLHDRGAGEVESSDDRENEFMLHSDKLSARRAPDTRQRVVPTFLPGTVVAVWRMMKGGGIPGKRAQRRWRPGLNLPKVRDHLRAAPTWDAHIRPT